VNKGIPQDASDALATVVLDAALEVHRHLGPALIESVYENALRHELSLRRVPFERHLRAGCRRVVLTR